MTGVVINGINLDQKQATEPMMRTGEDAGYKPVGSIPEQILVLPTPCDFKLL